jgi:UDP-N-acetylmuramoylalanine--D-glutamate ligase
MIATSSIKAIVGTGATGLSVARFLARQGQPFVLFDTRKNPPNLARLTREFPDVKLRLGALDAQELLLADEVIVSPGIAVSTPALAAVAAAGIPLIGDIELFVRHARAPLVAITGSNAKSTVTTLVGQMAKDAGIKVAVGGNLGTPVLDLLDDSKELYVLELSSFQLETVSRLDAKVATILNLSPDHMDRYDSLQAYHAAKLRVYFGAENIVVNRNDVLTHPPLAAGAKPIFFGGAAEFRTFGLIPDAGEIWLAWQFEKLLPASALKIKGTHNLDNALAALALGHAAGIPLASMVQTLKDFAGLPHRCEWVASHKGVDFFNDSKGTNVGATLAAIKGLARAPAKLVLIAGGEGKGGDFAQLSAAVSEQVRTLVLIGRDARLIADAQAPEVQVVYANSMDEAVARAYGAAQPGDAVLLSPACASFDMFSGYVERGEKFCEAVRGLSS